MHQPNRQKNGSALSASGYTVGLVGDITPGVLHKLLAQGTEAFDGWANRFLWCCVQSPRSLPSGGNIAVLEPFLKPLAEAIRFSRVPKALSRSFEAEALWNSVYPRLKASGDSVPHTDRARPYVLRLSLLYAIADCSEHIKLEHLQAALAVWEYCRASAELLFGSSSQEGEAKEDSLEARLLKAIVEAPGINRTALREVVGHKLPAEAIEGALASLEAQGLAHRRTVTPEGGGRPAECWWPGPEVDNPSSPSDEKPGREQTNSPPEAGPEAVMEAGREQTNSPPEADGSLRWREGTNSEPEAGPEAPLAGISLFPPPSAEKEKEEKVVNHEGFKAEAEAWAKAVHWAGGRIEKQDDGSCELYLPDKPGAEALRQQAELYLPAICPELLTEAEFFGELNSLLLPYCGPSQTKK